MVITSKRLELREIQNDTFYKKKWRMIVMSSSVQSRQKWSTKLDLNHNLLAY